MENVGKGKVLDQWPLKRKGCGGGGNTWLRWGVKVACGWGGGGQNADVGGVREEGRHVTLQPTSSTSSGSLWWGEAEMRLEHLKKEKAGNQLVKIVGVPGRVGVSGAPSILCQ